MQRGMCGALAALAVTVGAAWPVAAQAQDAGQLVVIQQRKFTLKHELEFAVDFAPLDAFSKGLGGEVAYAYHFNDAFSWEVIRGAYFAQLSTGLKTQLSQEFGVAPTQFELMQYYATSSLQWSPYYGKLARNNGSITHIEVFFTAGPAVARFTNSFAAGPELGAGFRVFLTHTASFRVDLRDAYFFSRSGKDVVFVTAGLSLSMGGND